MRRNALIDGVTLAKVNEMAKKYFDASRLLVVITGTPAPQTKVPPPPTH